MYLLRTGFLPSLLAAVVLILVCSQGITGTSTGGRVRESPSAWEGSGSLALENHGVLRLYDPLLLSSGRLVYADLQRARQAALNRESTNLEVALQESRDTIHRLELPSQIMARDEKSQNIRNDLKDRSKDMNHELRVPVEADNDEVPVYVPDKEKPRVTETVHMGKAAARGGDRETALAKFDVVTSSIQYRLGMLPPHKVKKDMDTAWATASLPKPDWAGTPEAIQGALAPFHWYTRQSAYRLLDTCNAVISACMLAESPRFRPDRKQKVLDYLSAAERELESAPGSNYLADKAGDLLEKVEPQGGDIKVLLHDIQFRIQDERQNAADRYRVQIGHGAAV